MEEKDIQDFLDSGLLEQYVIGATDEEQSEEVVAHINSYPEIKFAYQKLQEELKLYSNLYAKKPPLGIKEQILSDIYSGSKSKEVPTAIPFKWLSIAAIFIGLAAITGLFYINGQNNDLQNQLSKSTKELQKLQVDVSYANAANGVLVEELDYLKNSNTQKLVLIGNKKALGLRATAFVNTAVSKGYIEIENLPKLDEQHDYQLWADVDGEMISLAVLDDNSPKMLNPEIVYGASSLNITIEPAGGNDHATVENLVAATALKARP